CAGDRAEQRGEYGDAHRPGHRPDRHCTREVRRRGAGRGPDRACSRRDRARGRGPCPDPCLRQRRGRCQRRGSQPRRGGRGGGHPMITSAAPEPATSVPVIDGQAITKLYPGPPPVTALHPTCVRIHAGEKLAILGASGSGKSTLLAILGALDDPSAGTVLVQGQDLSTLADAQRSAIRAATIGFVFQQFHLLPTVSAAENVATGLLY